MFSILRATERDHTIISNIGRVSVAKAHEGSSPDEILTEYLENKYCHSEIQKELADLNNIYYLIYYNHQPAGFSKIIVNARHPNITRENVTLLDRIYLLKEFYDLKLGFELLEFNIELSKNNNQSGMWLYVWMGNTRAIEFYKKAGFKIIGSHEFHVAQSHYDSSFQMFLDFPETGTNNEGNQF